MFQESWIDVDEDEGLEGLPLLDDLPPILEPAFSAPVSPEKSCSQETNETSAAGSAVDNTSPKGSTRNVVQSSRFRFHKDSTPSRNQKVTNSNTPGTVFIGNFPPACTLEDFQRYLNLKGVQVREIRLGPRKKHAVSAMSFAYADMASDIDFKRLLDDDGSMYLGRKIRIDQATPHRPKPNRAVKSPYFGSRRPNQNHLRMNRTHSAPMPRHQGGNTHRSNRASRFMMNRSKAGNRSNYNKRSSPKMRRRPSRDKDANPFEKNRTASRFSEPGRSVPNRSRFGRRN